MKEENLMLMLNVNGTEFFVSPNKCVAKIRSESRYVASRNTFLPGCVHQRAGLKVCA